MDVCSVAAELQTHVRMSLFPVHAPFVVFVNFSRVIALYFSRIDV
jgi:hypothetical protein